MVGSSALLLAAEYDKPRREQGLGVFDVDVGGGTIVDAKEHLPILAILSGRAGIYNMMRNDEPVPAELQIETLAQLGVGQFAKDMQFGNDLPNIVDIMVNKDEARGASSDGFAKVAGNFAAGFTRPLDAVNKTIGFVMGTDTAKDVRQAEGFDVFTQSATKYIDNF